MRASVAPPVWGVCSRHPDGDVLFRNARPGKREPPLYLCLECGRPCDRLTVGGGNPFDAPPPHPGEPCTVDFGAARGFGKSGWVHAATQETLDEMRAKIDEELREALSEGLREALRRNPFP